ncbi:MAG: BON domain-containing protein [Elusimicrobia bacterium]|nr:BON domain-containing protein [Elusimicrobiota bacterium]
MKRTVLALLGLWLVLSTAGCLGTAQAVDDSDPAIKARIEATLRGRTDIDSRYVSIDVNDGVVTLSGIVASPEQQRAIVRIARRTHGVEQTLDNLLLQE